jgi:hypothetical protein
MPTNLKAISVRQLMRQKPPGWLEELLLRFGARAAAPAVAGTASYIGGRLAERRRTRKKLGFAMDEQIETYPMKSQAQRRFLHAVHPDIAAEFESKTPAGKKLPEHAKVKKYMKIPRGGIHSPKTIRKALASKRFINRRSVPDLIAEGMRAQWQGTLTPSEAHDNVLRRGIEHAQKKYELPLGSRLKWGAKRWVKRAALVGGGALGSAAYVKTRRAKKEYDVLRSAGFTPQEATEIAAAGVLGKYSLSYQSPTINPIRTGLGQIWGGLQSGYKTTAPHVQEWLKKPTTRRLALAGAGAGYYLGKRKRKSEGYSLYQQYKNNPDLMRAIAARDGVELDVQRYAIQDVLTGWQLGYKHGEEEAQGTRPAPGALRLGALMTLHGESYVLGRQKALTEAGMHGGARQSESFLETLVKSVDRLLSGDKNAEASQTATANI